MTQQLWPHSKIDPGKSSSQKSKRHTLTEDRDYQETLHLLYPIAKKWRILGKTMGLDSQELDIIKDGVFTDEDRLKDMFIRHKHKETFKDHSQLYRALIAMEEIEVAESLDTMRLHSSYRISSGHTVPVSGPFFSAFKMVHSVPQLHDTKERFSNLLNAITRTVKHKPPRELAHMINCFDKEFCAFTSDCRDTDDVITALIYNVTFLDYDLLQYLANATGDKALQSDIKVYTTQVEYYLEQKATYDKRYPYHKTFIIDKDMGIFPGDKRSIDKLETIFKKIIKENVSIIFSDDFNKPRKLKGVDVLKEVEVTIRNSAFIFEWKGYGFMLTVPESALSADKLTVTIRASLSGQYSFPDGTQLVSPIFWISCQLNEKFLKPLSLEIQHCALPENSFHLYMVKAICTQQDLPYNFKPLFGGTFTKHCSFGAIELNGFSGVGVVQERVEERRYWSSAFYMGPSSSRNIHFAVTWHTDAHITAVKSHYKSKKAESGPEQALVFKEESITLDVPKKGIDINDGWKVIPVTPPEIEKKEVDDHHHENQAVAHCELLAKWLKDKSQTKPLIHTVNISGTTKEKYFVISIDPEIKNVEEADCGLTPSKLEIRHLHNICKCLKDLPREDLIAVGLALGLHYPTLKKMQQLPEDMVEAWLLQRDSVTHPPTTETLVQALEQSGFTGTADVIKTKFI